MRKIYLDFVIDLTPNIREILGGVCAFIWELIQKLEKSAALSQADLWYGLTGIRENWRPEEQQEIFSSGSGFTNSQQEFFQKLEAQKMETGQADGRERITEALRRSIHAFPPGEGIKVVLMFAGGVPSDIASGEGRICDLSGEENKIQMAFLFTPAPTVENRLHEVEYLLPLDGKIADTGTDICHIEGEQDLFADNKSDEIVKRLESWMQAETNN